MSIAMAPWLAVLTLLAACRPGEGQRCVCAGECRRGLVCAQNGRVLDDKECVPSDDSSPGVCIEQDQGDAIVDEGLNEDPPTYHDVGGKRDFEPGPPPAEDEGSSAAVTSGGTTTSSTGATSSSTGASSSSTGASSSSTGASSSSTGASSGSSGTTNGSSGSP